ncbi:MAG: hypothetical protein LBL15_06510 [Oscillospiraceae bacterium]|jgi:hypothetical protein|nr:hypothetical protein [Oscillospiraceae bacterium]
MKMNLRPAFRYQFGSSLRSAVIILLIILAIFVFLAVGTFYIAVGAVEMRFTGYSISFAIFLFVMGIVGVRSDMRLCLQCGVSRRTAFVSGFLATLCLSFVLALSLELLTALVQLWMRADYHFFSADLYQILYLSGSQARLTAGQHVISVLVNTSTLFASGLLGNFFSLLYWRLNKALTVLVSLAFPVLPSAVSWLMYRIGVNLKPFIDWVAVSPFNFVLSFMLGGIVCAGINWLLLRRADIRSAAA